MLKKPEFAALAIFAAMSVSVIGFGATYADTAKPKPDPVQLARGAKAWAQNCARCHNLKSPKDYSDAEWHVDVTHMRVRANIPGDVAKDIIAFLQASNN